jgi:hypothetical protein
MQIAMRQRQRFTRVLGSVSTARKTMTNAHKTFSDTRGTHSTQHTSLEWHVNSYCRRPHKEISTVSFYTLRQAVANAPTGLGEVL